MIDEKRRLLPWVAGALLFGLLLALMALLPGALALLVHRERHKPSWNCAFTNPFMLAAHSTPR